VDKIVIFGAGGFGREVAWLIEEINQAEHRFHILGFLDDDPFLAGKTLNGYPVFEPRGFIESNQGVSVALAVGEPITRMALADRLSDFIVRYPNLIHPTVRMSPTSTLGMGNILCAGVIVTVNARIGNFCHLNLKTTVGHDCVLEDFGTTACGVDLGGRSHIERGAYLGNHATVLQSVRVGEKAIVGAGSVVNRDLPPGTVSVGIPARVIKP
jgi:sugar O-acyltransferase (sialic acid O-acetyltransferase NeuD family)